MVALVVFAVLCAVACGIPCAQTLQPGQTASGSTDDGCMYELTFGEGVALDRLWTLDLTVDSSLPPSKHLQMVVLDDTFTAFHTVGAEVAGDVEGRETLCRKLRGDSTLDSRFWLQPVGAPGIRFNVTIIALPGSRLLMDVPAHVIVRQAPIFVYAMLDPSMDPSLPVSVEVSAPFKGASMNAPPYELQLSWLGCPDITLRDARHQVLTFSTKGRMLVLPSQLGTPRPEVLYIGLRPSPSALSVYQNSSTSPFGTLNVTVTFSYGASFSASSVAVLQWGIALALLVFTLLVATAVSWFICRVGLRKVRGGGTQSDDEALDVSLIGLDMARQDAWTRGRAKAYLWMISMGGVFYLLPSLQTASSEASGMLRSGNRDACFFNDLCMFPLQTTGPYAVTWWAANSIISNFGYMVVGLALFAWIMWCKHHWKDRRTVLRVLALPYDYTLFFCLAVTILYEGAMSATYHVCPNRLIFTVDSAFMFVGSLLVALEVYRKWFRVLPHPMFPFLLLTVLLVFNYFGTLLDLYTYDNAASDAVQEVLWAVCFSFMWNVTIVLVAIRHRMRMQAIPLAICTAICCLLGLMPFASLANHEVMDRSTIALGVSVGTAMVMIVAYVFGTLLSVDWPTRIFRVSGVAASLAAGIPAVIFFARSPTNKALPPWESRALNVPCNFYDDHDRWHFLSALALGLTVFLLIHCGEDADRSILSQNMTSKPKLRVESEEPEPDEKTRLI